MTNPLTIVFSALFWILAVIQWIRHRLGHHLLADLLRLADVFRWRHRAAFHILEQLNDVFTRMTWPFLRPIRRMLRGINTAGIDWSPFVLLFFIFVLRQILAWAAGAILLK